MWRFLHFGEIAEKTAIKFNYVGAATLIPPTFCLKAVFPENEDEMVNGFFIKTVACSENCSRI